MITPDRYRETVARLLDWDEAHAGFDKALSGIPPELRGVPPEGLPYSPWQLLEHLRLAQRDILDFCRDPDYTQPEWPEDYWPPTPAPRSADEWERSVEAFRGDRDALRRLASDPDLDLTAEIPHGEGQTYLRELLLVADHNAYHLGQLVVVRRLLGIWPP
ncbi:DinB family protein [soil metagenome]